MGNAAWAVEGRDAEIFSLLSLAQGRAISPNVLHGLRGVAKSFAQGDAVGAAFRLALLGLPPLRGPRDAEMLKTGATFLARGFSPWAILREAGIEGPAVELCKAQWDENLHPRDPATGRFIEAGSGTVVTASAARALIAAGATQISAGAFALAGGALLSLTAAGWVLSQGPKGKIEDGPSYWLPGVSSDNASDEGEGKDSTPGIGHNGGPSLDQTPQQDPNQKPGPSVAAPANSTSSGKDKSSSQGGEHAPSAVGRSMGDILMPNGEAVGYVYSGAQPTTRIVMPEQFGQLKSELMEGAVPIVAASGYEGVWYQRPDGTVFGIRTSKRFGQTLDVIKSNNLNLPSGFKVHQR